MARIEIIDIRPEPSPEVRAAIEQALEEVWPSPRLEWEPTPAEQRWRFGSRPWTPPSIPLRRWSLR